MPELEGRLRYPQAPRSQQIDDYFGTTVADPFRTLEALEAPQTVAWLEGQSALAQRELAAIPGRDELRNRIARIFDYERISLPLREAGTVVVARNSGLQRQDVFLTGDDLRACERVLLDPNALSEDGTAAVFQVSLSRDGKLLAYAVQRSGSDWNTWSVREVASGRDLPDVLEWSKFAGATWAADGRGFFYGAYPRPSDPGELNVVLRDHRVFYHSLGTSQQDDRLVYADPAHPLRIFETGLSDDGRWFFVVDADGAASDNGLLALDLEAPGATLTRLFEPGEARYSVVATEGERLLLFTTAQAPRGRVVTVDLRTPGELHELIGESREVLSAVSRVGERLFATYLHDAQAVVRIFDLDGAECGAVALPGLGSVAGFSGRASDRDTFYAFSSFTQPPELFRYELASGKSERLVRPRVAFDPERYRTEQIFARSCDGTRVPAFVVARKDFVRDGTAPTILYGYGGFAIDLLPWFSPAIVAWLELGGVYAVATLRGGGEYGEDWHRAGMRERKQNVFDDFAAAARALVADGTTSPQRLAVRGASNGGLLCAATITQHPELAAASLCSVGVYDLLRFPKFTVGAAWIPEYGDPEASPGEFETLHRYSPLHNLRDGTHYPATLITTADHDDRVFPAHSFKFAAALQAAQGGSAPILLAVERKAGHGAGKPTDKQIDELALQYAFALAAFGLPLPDAQPVKR